MWGHHHRFITRSCRRYLSLLAGILVFCAVARRLGAQSPSELSQFATMTAERVARSGKGPILIAPLNGCLLDAAMCSISDSLLRSELERQIPNVTLIDRDAVEHQLKSRGLLAIDAYDPLLIQGLALQMGAQILVMEDLYWDSKHKHYTLDNSIFDPRTLQRIVSLKTPAQPAVQGDDPVIYRDPESGTSLIVPNKKRSGFRVFRLPNCADCPVPARNETPIKPTYAIEYLAVTITKEGTVSSIGCFRAGRDCEEAANIVRTWRFKPAIDFNGIPFAVRSTVYVDLNGGGRADPSSVPPWRNDSW